MVFISLIEILNILIATAVVGFIFTGLLPFRSSKKDVLDSYTKRFDWSEFWFACLVAAPGIILHEMAHKFVAMGFGLNAFFELSYFGLLIGVVLKLLGSGLILLAPGYVVITGANIFQGMLTAFAGPFINLLLWIVGLLVVKYSKSITRRHAIFWTLTKEVNKWLFIFNILPIPPLDGYKVWIPLFKILFGI